VLAVTIALTCVALALVVFGVEQWLDANARAQALLRLGNAASAPPAQAAVPMPSIASAPTASTPPAAVAAAAAAASAPRTEEEVDRQQMAALEAEMKQRARAAAEQAALEAVRRKERAWERWYQRPAFCNENPTAAQMVHCANHHIRARKEFEERYMAGRL
jgi:type IV secretory pathway VirB10-like protein